MDREMELTMEALWVILSRILWGSLREVRLVDLMELYLEYPREYMMGVWRVSTMEMWMEVSLGILSWSVLENLMGYLSVPVTTIQSVNWMDGSWVILKDDLMECLKESL